MGFFSKSKDNNSASDSENEKWKNKYLNLLDAQEHAEKAQKLDQELLCKTIVRLSIAATGVDPQLEPYLERIRNHVKNGVDSQRLKTELENFTDALNRINDGSPKQKEAGKDISLLFAFLLQHYKSDKQQQALKQLEKDCQPLDDPKQLFSAIAEIIKDDQMPKTAVEPSTEEVIPTERLIDSAYVTGQLLQLLQNIEVPESSALKAQALKQELEGHDASHALEATLDGVVSLLLEINANVNDQPKQQDIDKFIAHITQQLTELGLAVTDSGVALMNASLERSKLDESVTEQMSDLQNRSVNATQLEPLKQVISSHIAQITKEIQEHKQKEANQRENYQSQLDELGQKIKVMESETGELKSKLITATSNAERDILTNLPNRLAYDERLKMEIARWQRYHTPLCLVVWDIDFFKKVNDQYGHQVGDKVLVQVGNQFLQHIRRADFVARFGGEEFVMLLPHTNKHSALKVTEKLRTLIEENALIVNEAALTVTVSCGITQFFKGDTHESAFERADQALYRAKELGRNQCCMG